MIIGVTGLMGSGKTSLCKEIINIDKSFQYLDVDIFRRDLLSNTKSYVEELSKILNAKINNYQDLNNIIYKNDISMRNYKQVLYKYLLDYINKQKENLLVEWALIIQDDIQYIFDKLIIINRNIDDILLNEFSDLSKEDIEKRLEIQKNGLIGKEIIIPYIEHKNIKETIEFILMSLS